MLFNIRSINRLLKNTTFPKRSIFFIWTLIFLITQIGLSQICLDGNYCPVPSDISSNSCFSGITDEYANAEFQLVSTSPSSTCEVGLVWLALDISNELNPKVFTALTRGNSGNSFFRAYFDTDCNSLTGAQTAFESGFSGPMVDVGGAEYLVTIQGNGSINSIESWNSLFNFFLPTSSNANAIVGNSDGCNGIDGVFIEVQFPLLELFEVCNTMNNCGEIELTTIIANSGGSSNSSFCRSDPINLVLPVNLNAVPGFVIPDTICQNFSTGEFPAIEIDAGSYTTDPDVTDGRDSLVYLWTSTDPNAVSAIRMASQIPLMELNTQYQAGTVGNFEINLFLTDHFGCESLSENASFIVLPNTNPACDCSLPDISTSTVANICPPGGNSPNSFDLSSIVITDSTVYPFGQAAISYHSATPASPDNDITSTPVAGPSVTTTYYILATSPMGGSCSAEIPFTVFVESVVPDIICPMDSVVSPACEPPAPASDFAEYLVMVPGGLTDNGPLEDLIVEHVGDLVIQMCSAGMPEVIERTYRVTDSCGLASSCVQMIMLDFAPPAFNNTCPLPDESVFLDTNCGYELSMIQAPEANSFCDPGVTISFSDNLSGLTSCSGTGTIIRTWMATDSCMQVSTCSQNIVVSDNTAPFVTAPDDTNLDACSIDSATINELNTGFGYSESSVTLSPEQVADFLNLPGASVNEACNYNIMYTDTQSGSCPVVISRVFTITDECLNQSSDTQTITINDAIPLPIECPQTVQAIEGCDEQAITITNSGFIFSDVETGISVGEFLAVGGIINNMCTNFNELKYIDQIIDDSCPNPVMQILRTFMITNDCGFSNTCTQTISVSRSDARITIDVHALDGADIQAVNPNAAAGFEIIITNNGIVDLINVIVEDASTGICNLNVGPLAAGATFSYTCSVPGVNQNYSYTMNVTADPADCGCVAPSASDNSVIMLTNPQISIDKHALDGSDSQNINPGGSAAFEITVANSGDVALENIVINDPAAPDCNNTITNLSVGEIFSYTCQADEITTGFINTVNVTADPVGGGDQVIGLDESEVILNNPDFNLDISAADGGDIQFVSPGADAEFLISITNTGDVALENAMVSIPLIPGCDTVIGMLEVGETVSYNCSFVTVTEGFSLFAEGTATPAGGGYAVINSDTIQVSLYTPGISITKSAPDNTDNQLINPGQSAIFEIIITNTGDVALETITTFDLLSQQCNNVISNLAPGASFSYNCSQPDVQEGFINHASVVATPVDGGYPVEDEDSAEVLVTHPAITIEKTGINGTDPYIVFPGLDAIFEITVTNIGDVNLTDIVINDPLAVVCNNIITSLPVGESFSYSCTLDEPTDFINTVITTGIPAGGGDPVSDQDDVTVYVCQEFPLVCNDFIQVSVDENCRAIITTDMLLDGPLPSELFFEIIITDENGIEYGDSVTAVNIGQALTFSVTNICSGNSCWGTLLVEDKLPPEITCPNDATPDLICSDLDTIYTSQETILGAGIELVTGNPTVIENCGPVQVRYFDELTEGGMCDDGVIVRTFIAEDPGGNLDSCTQMITVRKPEVGDTTLPGSFTIACDALDNFDPQSLYEAGYDGLPLVTTFFGTHPVNETYCNLGASFSDAPLVDLCGGSFKIIRTWTVFDWCTTETATQAQIIKVEDATAPAFDCPVYPEIAAFIENGNCSVDVELLPIENFTDNCSSLGNVSITITLSDGSIAVYQEGDIVNLPAGTHTLTYNAADECDNEAQSCESTVNIIDDAPPVAICDAFTAVSINADGTSFVCWQTFDDGSYDNCSDIYFRVKRMDAGSNVDFTECIEFDCSDVGNEVMVRMRVYDVVPPDGFDDNDNGRFNECMVVVEVEDKLDPVITCPADKTIDCHGDDSAIPELSDSAAEGLAAFYYGQLAGYYSGAADNCNATVNITDSVAINNCGEGFVFRNWTVEDEGGLIASCSQLIVLINQSPFEASDISWPSDHTVDCSSGLGTDPDDLPEGSNYPQFQEDACDHIAVTYEDVIVAESDSACYKIIRKWIVADWCQFDESIVPYENGYWEYSQVIAVQDYIAPVITSSCETVEVCNYEIDCGPSWIELILEAEDACADNLNYNYSIDINDDGVYETGATFNGESNDASGNYANGTHRIYWSVEDGCGNITSCNYPFIVKDCKKPTLVLITGLATVVMPSSLEITLWATDFDGPDSGSFDNCTASGDLLFFVRIVNPINNTITNLEDILNLGNSVSFNCTNLGITEVEIYVVDEAGNWDYATTYADIQDPNGVCSDFELADVTGHIFTEFNDMVSDVQVESSNSIITTPMQITEDDGYYAFQVPAGNNYIITPERDDNPLNGVTTFDMVLISKHILGVQLLDSPYKMIAADINRSNTITTYDLVQLRRLILNIDTAFQQNTSWRFVEASFIFPDPANPFNTTFPEIISINELDQEMADIDFIAVKIGDVNSSVVSNSFSGTQGRAFENTLLFNVKEQALVKGNSYKTDFRANDFKQMLGYQFTLNFEPNALAFAAFQPGLLTNLDDANIGLLYLDEGIITSSWHKGNPVTVKDGQVLFSIIFDALADTRLSESFSVNNVITPAEAYNTTEHLAVALQFSPDNAIPFTGHAFELYQNVPNPFKHTTTVGFNLPEATSATLRIIDINGKVIKIMEGNFVKGYNELQVNTSEFLGSGLFYYELTTRQHNGIKRMVVY